MRRFYLLVDNCLSLNQRQHLLLVLPKIRVIENTRLAFLSLVFNTKIVHIELADEGL